nr:hypothetical protein [Tanacetum cinerariifolium]
QEIPPDVLAAHTTWVMASKEIVGLMVMTMAQQELLQTVRDFYACKHEEGQSMSSYVLKMKSYMDNLERLDHLMSLNLITINEMHAMLMLYEHTLPNKDAAPALHAVRAGSQKTNHKNKTLQMVAEGNCCGCRKDFYTRFYNSIGRVPNRCSSSISKTRGLLSFSRGIGWE